MQRRLVLFLKLFLDLLNINGVCELNCNNGGRVGTSFAGECPLLASSSISVRWRFSRELICDDYERCSEDQQDRPGTPERKGE